MGRWIKDKENKELQWTAAKSHCPAPATGTACQYGFAASSAESTTGKSYHVGDEKETREKAKNLRLYMLTAWKLPCVC